VASPPLSHSLLHPGSVISGHEFLAETLSSWPYRKRDTERTKDFTWQTPKSPKWEFETKYPLVGMVHGHLRDGYDECVSFGDIREDRKHTTISLNLYISKS
jgi:hypothetical protein